VGADIVAGPFVYQAKLRRGMSSYLRDWLRGIVAAAGPASGARRVGQGFRGSNMMLSAPLQSSSWLLEELA